MAPWWIRPTSDGPSEAGNDAGPEASSGAERAETPQQHPGPARAAAQPREEGPEEVKSPSPAPAGEPAPQSDPETPEPEGRNGGGRSRRSRGRRSRRGPRAADSDVLPTRLVAAPEVAEEVPDESPSLETILREIFLEAPDRTQSDVEERKIALFCDFENIALGVRDSESKKFELSLVLDRLREKGKVIVKKAYSDWSRYSDFKKTFHESGIELIEIPQKYYSGKNSADIKMVVDAMDLCYSNEHIDTFVIMSGDSDFTPLVSKLKENNKYVIGLGVKNATSTLLTDNCDEFIYYEDLWRDAQTAPLMKGLKSTKDSEVFSLMTDAMLALIRENKEVLWGSMIKQTMKRKRPSFNEGYYGYRTFSELLEDAERKGIVRLKKDKRSGSYIVKGFGDSRG